MAANVGFAQERSFRYVYRSGVWKQVLSASDKLFQLVYVLIPETAADDR